MELNNEDDSKPTPCALLGRRLRRLREQADLSLRGLADKVGYPHTYLSRIERGEQLPSENLAEDLDTYFTTDGLFVELLSLAHDPSIPDYARVVVDSENRAARVQVFSSSLVPGLLQTEDYARAVFRASLPGEPREKIDFASGEPADSPQRIIDLTQRFDLARAKALPESESLDAIQSYLKEYEDDDDS